MFKSSIPLFGFILFSFISSFSLNAIEAEGGGSKSPSSNLSTTEKRKFDYFFYEGLNLKNSGKYDAAYEAFNHSLEIDSTASAVLYELSNFHLQMNRPLKAVEYLKRAVDNSPDNFTYKMALASVTFSLGMYGEAAEEYEKLSKEYPSKVELNYYLAEAFTQQGEIGKAIEAYDALESSMGMNEGVSVRKYKLYNLLGESEKGIGEIIKLVEKYPMEPRYTILLGDLYLEKNEKEKALEAYNKANQIDPENPYYIVAMANYYEVVGEKDAAEKQIENALLNEKLDVEIKVSILSRYILTLQQTHKDTESAVALFETLMQQHPEENELKLMFAGLLILQGKNEEARFQLQLVTEMEPENMNAWQQLLQLSLKNQDLPEVIRVCKKCIELFPDAPEYYFYLGIAYYQQEDYQQALETYYKGLEIIPVENPLLRSDFYGQIGDIYYQTDQMDKAFEAYEEALKYHPNNVVVLNNYAYFLSLAKKELKKAERMSAITVKEEPQNSTYLDTYAWIYFVQGNYTFAKIYIERALANDKTESTELLDHYGDILFMNGEQDKAVEQWIKARDLGKESEVLERKISERRYIEDENAK